MLHPWLSVGEHRKPGHRSEDATPRHLSYLDGWRGIAILCVLAGHSLAIPHMRVARFGVELFFVLSGRLMAELLFVQRQSLPYFFKRRVARVWPALYLYVLLIAVVAPRTDGMDIDWEEIAGALTFTLNYVRFYTGPERALDHIWSLCVEEWAYVALAMLALITRRYGIHPTRIIITIAVICVVNGIVQYAMTELSYREVYWRTDVRLSSIFLSAGIYLALRDRERMPSYVPLLFGCLGTILNLNVVPDPLKNSLGTVCLSIAVATVSHAPRWLVQLLSARFLTLFGLWSFSMYLWQQPFTKLTPHWPEWMKLIALISAALMSFYCVERPARRYLNQHWANRRTIATVG